jgi:hypothetical protein
VIRYHLDENVHHGIARGLRNRGIDVTTSTDANLVKAPDQSQLAFAISEGRILFTHDSDFLKPELAHQDHPGIVYSPKDLRGIGELIRWLTLPAKVSDPEEMRRNIEYL